LRLILYYSPINLRIYSPIMCHTGVGRKVVAGFRKSTDHAPGSHTVTGAAAFSRSRRGDAVASGQDEEGEEK